MYRWDGCKLNERAGWLDSNETAEGTVTRDMSSRTTRPGKKAEKQLVENIRIITLVS